MMTQPQVTRLRPLHLGPVTFLSCQVATASPKPGLKFLGCSAWLIDP